MVEPTARIRAFELSDLKAVRFYAGKAQMEGLTAANVNLYKNPFVIALWLGFSSAFVQYMKWWPTGQHGMMEYLKLLPAFFSMAVPILYFVDWYNRPKFEQNLQNTLRKPDLVDVAAYYTRSPASGLWFLELDNRFIGLIAIDASLDSTSEDVVVSSESKSKSNKLSNKEGTSEVATIRHFHVEELYRAAAAEDDLLEYALKHVFSPNSKVQVVRALESPLTPYIGKALRKEGFKPTKIVDTVGIFNWEVRMHELRREHWRGV